MTIQCVCWGTYDNTIPRTTILLDGAQKAGIQISICHYPLWKNFSLRAQTSKWKLLGFGIKAIAAYPRLVIRYLRMPQHDAVIVAYPGLMDLLVIWPFARLRKASIIFDGYLPLYEMVVEDRKLFKPSSIRAKLLLMLESWLYRRADIILTDTQAHADYQIDHYRLQRSRVKRVMVGAQEAAFSPEVQRPCNTPLQLLFYGTFVPLHGLQTVIAAARILQAAGEKIHFTLIGNDTKSPFVEGNITRLPNVSYQTLKQHIHKADIILGIFGTGGKTARVIPNKVFQALACHKPLITSNLPAIRELGKLNAWIRLCPAGDEKALAQEICALRDFINSNPSLEMPWPAVSEEQIGKQFKDALAGLA